MGLVGVWTEFLDGMDFVHNNTHIFKEHDHILAPNKWVWANTAYLIEMWCVAPFQKPVGGKLSADQRTYNYHVSRVSHTLFIFVSLVLPRLKPMFLRNQ